MVLTSMQSDIPINNTTILVDNLTPSQFSYVEARETPLIARRAVVSVRTWQWDYISKASVPWNIEINGK